MNPLSTKATLALTALATLAACSHAPHAAAPPATTSAPSGGGEIHRFRIGALDAVALKDGDLEVPNDGKTFGIGRPTTEVGDVLAAAGLPRDHIALSIQPLLVKDDERVLLFDTGLGNAPWAHAGRLQASLALAGVAPTAVTDIFISHAHPDHIGGLVTSTGALAFPNATVHIASADWAAMQKAPAQQPVASAIAGKVATFEPGARLLPEVTAVATPGHTPGHTSFEITSGGEKLLFLGDVAHHFVISLQRPAWTIAFDQDKTAAEEMREKTLRALAKDGERVYAVHFPFPGIGRVGARGEGFEWVPEQ